jgi:hypothetical protein
LLYAHERENLQNKDRDERASSRMDLHNNREGFEWAKRLPKEGLPDKVTVSGICQEFIRRATSLKVGGRRQRGRLYRLKSGPSTPVRDFRGCEDI